MRRLRYDGHVVSGRLTFGVATATALALGALGLQFHARAQAPAGGELVYSVITREGRRPLHARRADGRDLVALDDVGEIFGLTLREDPDVGSLTLTRQGQTIVVSSRQPLASVAGRVVALPAPPAREGRRWFAPVELLVRTVGPALGTRIDVRPASRLIVVGDLRVPRVDLRYEGAGPRARLLLDIAPAVPHRVQQETGRLAIAFDADALDAHLAPSESPSLVSAIRVAEPSTVVVELGPALASFRATELAAPPGTARLAVELVGAAGESRAGTPTPAAPPGPPPAPAPSPVPPLVEPVPPGGIRTIVIDPGHGGEDAGARGPGGTLEKDVTLTVARRLQAALESRLGVRVVLTRKGDESVRLDERAARANNHKADVFVSLHANASIAPAASGAEVLSLGLDEYAPGTVGAAAVEGPVLPVFGGGARRLDLVEWEAAQVQYLADSAMLAAAIENELGRRVPLRPHAVRRAPLRVLVGTNMPAVLVELGFLTNPDEERRLASEGHQAALAQALADGLVRFRERRLAPPSGTRPPGASPRPRP